MKFLWAALLLCFARLAAADHYNITLPENLDKLPHCAADCYAAAVVNSTCTAADEACFCRNPDFTNQAGICTMYNCRVAEILSAENVTATACGLPVRSRSEEYLIITIVLGAIAIVPVILRTIFKVHSKRDVGVDDWLIIACAIVGPPSTMAMAYLTTKNGLGKDIWTVSVEKLMKCGMYFFIFGFFYYTAMALLKLSFLFFYLKLFRLSRIRKVIWGTIIFTILWGLAFNFSLIFQCYPIRYFWMGFTGDIQGRCFNVNAVGWSHAAINIALDIWMLGIPLSQLRGLRLTWKKKLGVAFMFSVGSFVTIVSIIRLHSLVIYGNVMVNPTWDYIDLGIWTFVELDVGIICACLPSLRLILVRFFPRQFGTTPRQDTQKESAGIGRNSGGRMAEVDTEESGTETHVEGRGITLQRSYTVEYSDNDEAVLMGKFDSKSNKSTAYS